MLQNFDKKLRAAYDRRDAAIGRIRQDTQHAKGTLTQQVSDLRAKMDPEHFIRENPWKVTLGALAAGIVVAPLLRAAFFPRQSAAQQQHEPQRVVVDVVGAKRTGKMSAWAPVLDMLMAGVPALSAFAQKFYQQHADGNGASHATGGETMGEPSTGYSSHMS